MIWKYGLVGWVFVLAWRLVKWTAIGLAGWVAWPWFIEWDDQGGSALVAVYVAILGTCVMVFVGFSERLLLSNVFLGVAGFLLIPAASFVALGLFRLGYWLLKPPAGMFAWWRER